MNGPRSRIPLILTLLLVVVFALNLVGLTSAQEPDVTPEVTDVPTDEPTVEVTEVPTEEPTAEPTDEPTSEPTDEPTQEPTDEPTVPPEETEVPGDGGNDVDSVEVPEPAILACSVVWSAAFEPLAWVTNGDGVVGYAIPSVDHYWVVINHALVGYDDVGEFQLSNGSTTITFFVHNSPDLVWCN